MQNQIKATNSISISPKVALIQNQASTTVLLSKHILQLVAVGMYIRVYIGCTTHWCQNSETTMLLITLDEGGASTCGNAILYVWIYFTVSCGIETRVVIPINSYVCWTCQGCIQFGKKVEFMCPSYGWIE